MRTTVDLPDDLIKEAKVASAMRGISLKAYLTEALMRYRGLVSAGGDKARPERVQLPLIGGPDGPRIRPTNEELEQALVKSENLRLDP